MVASQGSRRTARLALTSAENARQSRGALSESPFAAGAPAFGERFVTIPAERGGDVRGVIRPEPGADEGRAMATHVPVRANDMQFGGPNGRPMTIGSMTMRSARRGKARYSWDFFVSGPPAAGADSGPEPHRADLPVAAAPLGTAVRLPYIAARTVA